MFRKVNISKKWVLDLLMAERPRDAAAQWTESKEHKRSIEKAIWLLCLQRQLQVMDERVRELKDMLREAEETSSLRSRVGEKLYEDLQWEQPERRQAEERFRNQIEYLQCHVTEAKNREQGLGQENQSLKEQIKGQREKYSDIQAEYKVACQEGFGMVNHKPCQEAGSSALFHRPIQRHALRPQPKDSRSQHDWG